MQLSPDAGGHVGADSPESRTFPVRLFHSPSFPAIGRLRHLRFF